MSSFPAHTTAPPIMTDARLNAMAMDLPWLWTLREKWLQAGLQTNPIWQEIYYSGSASRAHS